ncbi:unnamed protein product, partial [Polarella glacialis]
GLEAEDLALSRQKEISLVAYWIKEWGSAASVEVSGAFDRGEVGGGPQKSSDLALARAKGSVRFLISDCGLSAENCHASPAAGDSHQGVEIRSRARLDVDGSFEDGADSAHLRDDASLDAVAEQTCADRGRRLQIEVGTGAEDVSIALARSRCTALLRGLAARGVPRRAMSVRPRLGSVALARFFVHLEFGA